MEYIEWQMNLGPRTPGSNASKQFGELVRSFAQNSSSWQLSTQTFMYKNTTLTNYLITKSSFGQSFVENGNYIPKVVIGAHFDSRMRATKDSNNPSLPVPGANDGASGVAGIMALMVALDLIQIDLGFVLFDGEDQGFDSGGYGIHGWEWIVGSRHFAESIPDQMVLSLERFILLDMIGDVHLNLKKERNSDGEMNEQIWDIAKRLGYSEYFTEDPGYSIIDDHIPFIERGIRSVDLIDFDFPYHHTLEDDIENVSASSVRIVIEVVLNWIEEYFSVSYASSEAKSSTMDIAEVHLNLSLSVLVVFLKKKR